MSLTERCDEIVRLIDDVLWTDVIVRRFCGADVETTDETGGSTL
jgi:hypothetical protein